MNEKTLLAGLSYIDEKYIEEAETETVRICGFRRRTVFLAAVLVLMAALLGSALGAKFLQGLTVDMPRETSSEGLDRAYISLQGFRGSKGYLAFQEWRQFAESYKLKEPWYNHQDFECPEEYTFYYPYTQEMVDKLEEILGKYDLEPLGTLRTFNGGFGDYMFKALRIENLLKEEIVTETRMGGGYCYPDGTFDYSETFKFTGPWGRWVNYSCRSVQKTSFDGVARVITDLENYDQWLYTTSDGTEVFLALYRSEGEYTEGGFIVVDKEDCFLTIGIPNSFISFDDPGNQGIPNDPAFLEAVCEVFDFSYQVDPVSPEEMDAIEAEALDKWDRRHHPEKFTDE